MGKIYCIRNKINGKEYVGHTKNPLEKRFKQHSYQCKVEKSLISDAINKYGKDNFEIFKLYEGDDSLQKEDDFIQERKPAYNIVAGGGMPPTFSGKDHPMYGKKHSEETKAKLRLAWERTRESRSGKNNPNYGKPMPDSVKEALRKAMTGKKASEETREKLKGRVPWNKGKTYEELGITISEETRRKRSETIRKQWANGERTMSENIRSPEAIRKISESRRGKSMSEETKQKLREKAIGRGHTEETKEKLRQINLGKKQSSETIDKRRQTMKRKKEERQKTQVIGSSNLTIFFN